MLEQEWLARIEESDLARILESPYFPGRRICVSEALMQVCYNPTLANTEFLPKPFGGNSLSECVDRLLRLT
jgi:hypothetical protein